MTRKSFLIYIFFVIVISIVLVMLHENLRQAKVCFREHCFSVEIAETRISQANGLMFRRELPLNSGMLFVFKDESERSFWMKNMLIPLDMIFLNENKEVISIAKDVQPCITEQCPKIMSTDKAKYVLELNANIAEQINLEIGDRLNFEE